MCSDLSDTDNLLERINHRLTIVSEYYTYFDLAIIHYYHLCLLYVVSNENGHIILKIEFVNFKGSAVYLITKKFLAI